MENNYNKSPYTLILPLEAYRKIIGYARACSDTEITGFADVTLNKEDGKIRVGEVFLLEQEATGTTVNMSEEMVAKFNLEMIKKGHKQLPQLWWHSHVDMEAFFSVTDEDTSKELQNDNFNVSLVVNKRGQMKAKMYIYKRTKMSSETTMLGETIEEDNDIEEWEEHDPLPVQIEFISNEIPKSILDEVKKKVKATTYKINWKNPFKIEGADSDYQYDQRSFQKNNKHKKKHKTRPDIFTSDEQWMERFMKPAEGGILKRFSRDEGEVLEKIKKLELNCKWDALAKEYVWIDEKANDVYVDFWGVMEKIS